MLSLLNWVSKEKGSSISYTIQLPVPGGGDSWEFRFQTKTDKVYTPTTPPPPPTHPPLPRSDNATIVFIHNACCLPPTFLSPFFKFLLSNTDVLRKIDKKSNSFAKFGRGGRGANKVSYEKFESDEYGQIWLRSRLSIIAIINLT